MESLSDFRRQVDRRRGHQRVRHQERLKGHRQVLSDQEHPLLDKSDGSRCSENTSGVSRISSVNMGVTTQIC